jgi:hypothetical protein
LLFQKFKKRRVSGDAFCPDPPPEGVFPRC